MLHHSLKHLTQSSSLRFSCIETGGKQKKGRNPQNPPKGNLPFRQQMAMVLYLFISNLASGEGHIDAIYRALGEANSLKKKKMLQLCATKTL